MSKRLKQLQNRQAAIVEQMLGMSKLLETEERDAFTEEEDATFKELKAEEQSVLRSIKIEQEIVESQKRLATVPDHNANTTTQNKELNGTKPAETRIEFKRTSSLRAFKGPDAEDRAYASGQFLMAAVFNDQKAQLWCREHGIEMLAHSSAAISTGGVLVPDVLAQTIIDLRENYGVFRRNTRVMPMTSETVTVARRVSGLTAYFVGQNVAATESSMVFDGAQLTAKELAALATYPSALGDDAILNLADMFAQEIAYALSYKEDQCGFIGDGTSTYGGIVGAAVKINDGNHAGGIYTAASGNVSFETLDLEDFEGAVAKLPEYAKPMAKWYISSAGYAASMMRLMYAAGGNTVQTIGGGTGPSFLGYPVVISQVLNSTLGSDTSKIKALFGDLTMSSTLGDRRGIIIASSRDRYFAERQVAILGVERFDINNHDLGNSTTAGPLVALKTAGS